MNAEFLLLLSGLSDIYEQFGAVVQVNIFINKIIYYEPTKFISSHIIQFFFYKFNHFCLKSVTFFHSEYIVR